MEMPVNRFKRLLQTDTRQYGLWLSLVDPVAAEIAAGAGFDWLLIDGEHAPNDLRSVMVQLQVIAAYPVSPIVRPVRGEAAVIKQYLDVGAQTILVPMVESAAHAADMVSAVRYPPRGIRGVATARGSRWGRVDEYWEQADEEMCVIVQIESVAGLDHLDEIAAVDGVDALFVGPSDLAASLGHLGGAGHRDVRRTVEQALATIRSAGKGAGVLATTPETARAYADAGANFVGVGVDTITLARATEDLAAAFGRR